MIAETPEPKGLVIILCFTSDKFGYCIRKLEKDRQTEL